jgi:catechol 2,3-dioxygenase-like lactoylglutathione lyase family enzyme
MTGTAPSLKGVVPIFFVRDITATASWFRDRLGFAIDFFYGTPAFYGSVSRDGARIHLRHVDQPPPFAAFAASEDELILASIEVSDVRALHGEFEGRGVVFAQGLTTHEWGGTDFHVRDPDGNVFSFVTYA